MIKYDKMLYEVLINYIPKISNSLSEISEELKEMNIDDRLDNKLNDYLNKQVMNKKLIGYVRVSSEISKIKGNSINNQINKVNDFCNLNDYELVDVLKDEGKSGMEFSKRDGYLELINRCKSENINGVRS